MKQFSMTKNWIDPHFPKLIIFLVVAVFFIPGVALGAENTKPVFSNISRPTREIEFGKEITVSGKVNDDCKSAGYLTLIMDWGDESGDRRQILEKKCAGIIIRDPLSFNFSFDHTYKQVTSKFPYEYEIKLDAIDSSGAITKLYWTAKIAGEVPPPPGAPTVLSSEPNIDGRTAEITVTGNDEKKLYILGVDWGDYSDSYCVCDGDIEPCGNQGDTTCSNTFTHSYSKDGSYTIGAWATDVDEQHSKIDKHQIEIGDDGDDGDDGDGDNINFGPLDIENPLKFDTFDELIGNIISFLFTIVIILAPILLIIAGIMFLMAGGDPAKIQKAKKLILYTIIGFAIIAFARLFVELIQQVFGVKGE